MIRVALFLLFAAFPAFGAELKLATWNLNWLTLKQAGLPPDVVLRAPEDFARLAEYAVALNADAVALQEVASREAAEAVFPRDRYSIHLTRDRVMQRVGWAIRRGLRYDIHPDRSEEHTSELQSH